MGMPRSSVYKMTGPKSALRIPHIKIGGKVRFREADIDQWLGQLMVSSGNSLARLRGSAATGRSGHENYGT